MKIKKIIKILKENNLLKEYKNTINDIKNITYNSKEVKNNTLFICKGYSFKKEYLNEAINNGAICYISEKNYDIDIDYIIVSDIRKSMALIGKEFYKTNKNLFKIGITGTKGKTTTIYFLHNILNCFKKKKTSYISTIDYYTGKTYEKSYNTTPESLDIFKIFKEVEESNLEHIVMEISSQAVKLNRIYNIDFDIGGFLNIGIDHISSLEHENFEDYLNCKIEFLKKCQKIFLFKEIENYEYIKKCLNDKKIITFGFSSDSNYQIRNIRKKDKLTTFDLKYDKNVETYQIPMIGDFNCVNATLAIIIAKCLGVSKNIIQEGLLKTKVLGRMMLYEKGNKKIIIDYAHNKLSIESLFKAIKDEYSNHNLKVVVGLPGDKAKNRRKELANLLEKYASYTYLTTDDPGYEKVFDICNEIISNFKNYCYYEIVEDRKTAIKKAIQNSNENDVVAIIGKGHETYQLIEGNYIFYKSDIKIVEDLLS